jgi:hypothetical protein
MSRKKYCNHVWRMVGGTACQHSKEEGQCSRAVYECEVCKDCDYGESRGADDECSICPYRMTFKDKAEKAYFEFIRSAKSSKQK